MESGRKERKNIAGIRDTHCEWNVEASM